MRDEPITLTDPAYTPNLLLNKVAEAIGAHDDAALALMLDVDQSLICRARQRKNQITAGLMVRIMDRTDWTIKKVRSLAGMPFYGGAGPILIQSERRDFTRHRRGTAHRYAKLDDDKVRIIRTDPRSDRAVARELGVNEATIWNVRAGRTWKHVK